MNIPAAIIASCLGAAFFATEMTYFYEPTWSNHADRVIGLIFSSNHSKARVAVSRLLIVPSSADFTDLKTVELDKSTFVCGAVRAKDRAGHYSSYRDFVYTVASDAAGIDDDGKITRTNGTFGACPLAPQKKPSDPHNASPDGATMVKAIEKIVPQAVNAGLSAIAENMPAGAGSSSSGTLEQQVSRMANQMTGGSPVSAKSTGSGTSAASSSTANSDAGSGNAAQQQISSISNARFDEENEWRSDQLPAAWPPYPSSHPLARSTQKRSTSQAMALARSVEDRWEHSLYGSKNDRPTREEVQEACRALLSISPNDKAFQKAWSAFVRLRKIDRDLTS